MNSLFERAIFERAKVAIRATAIAFLMALALPVAAQTAPTKFIPTFLLYHGGAPALVPADAAKLAKFDLIELERLRYNNIGSNTWAAIKALNPNAQIYLYEMGPEAPSHLDGVTQVNLNGLGRYNVSRGHPMGSLNGNQPALFLLDSSGNRMHNIFTSNTAANQYWYLMDFGSAAYQSYWLEAVKADIVNQPWVADGVFANNCTTAAGAGWYSGTSAWYSTNATWSAAMNSFAGAITAGLHGAGQKLWCNRGYTGTIEGSSSWLTLDNSASPPDVLLEEGAFAVQWGSANTQFYTESEWKRQVDIMGAIKNSKVAMLSHTKLLADQAGADNYGRPVTYWQTLWFSLGSFLLGKNDQLNSTYFMFTGGSGFNKISWHDEYDKIDLGKAIGPYAVRTIASVKVYWREFEKGYVYVNPSPSNATSVSLPQASKLLTHDNLLSAPSSIANVNAISLKSHEAAILLKADSTPPSVPTGLTRTVVSATQINLAWSASTDNVAVTGYRVYRGGALITTLGNVTAYQNTGLSPSTAYSYTVQAIDAAGNASAQSTAVSATTQASTDTTAPSVPTGLTGTAVSATQINLAWSASTDNVAVTGYRVERCQGAGCANFAQVGTSTGTSYSNTGLAAGTSYTFRARAVDAAGNLSGYSTIVSATTPASGADITAPSVPTGLTGTAVSATQINLAWSASTDNIAVAGYRVYRGGTLVASPTTTSVSITGLSAGTTYAFTVSAVDTAGNASAQSAPLSMTTAAPFSALDPYLGDAANWEPLTPARWSVVTDGGDLRYGINTTDFAALPTSRLGEYSLVKNRAYGDFSFSARVKSTEDFTANAAADYAVAFGFQDANNYYYALLNRAGTETQLFKVVGGVRQASLATVNFAIPDNNFHLLGVTRNGSLITVSFDGVNIMQASDSTFGAGRIGIGGFNDASRWDDIVITAGPPTTDTQPPTVPANLTRTVVSATQINLAWSASTDNVAVTGYRVYRGGALITTLGNVTAYQNTGLSPSTAYSYTVQAIDAAGNASAQSTAVSATTQASTDTTAPSVPTGLTGTAVSATQINLAWSASTDNVAVTGYRVERCQGAGCANFAQVGTSTGTSYSNTGLAAGTGYTFRARAVDAAGNLSGYSTIVSATTSSAPPATGTATLAWDAVTAANPSGYRVYYGTAPGTYVQPLGQGVNMGNVTSYTVTGLNRGIRYYFVVTAYTSSNESIWSNQVFKDIP